MNRGILKGLGGPVQIFSPQVRAATTDPTFGIPNTLFGGSGTECRFVVVDGICIGTTTIEWGTSGTGGSGTYFVEAPVPGLDPRSRSYAVGDYPVGTMFFSGSRGAGGGMAMLSTSPGGTPRTSPGGWFTLQANSFMTGGSTSFAAATTKTVTHNLATTPDFIMLTPQDNRTLWVTSLGATTFVANAAASNSAAFYWQAFIATNTLGSAYPYAFGTVLDHIEFNFAYPVG